jgi:hypothetical protein
MQFLAWRPLVMAGWYLLKAIIIKPHEAQRRETGRGSNSRPAEFTDNF